MGRNLGRAIASIGDDVLAYSKLTVQEEALRLRDARERMSMELRERLRDKEIDARLAIAEGRNRARDTDGGWVPEQSDDRVAAVVNSTLPEGADAITGPRVAGVRSLLKDGPKTEVKATADTPGMEYLDPADRADLEAKGGMRGETAGTLQARRDAGWVSRGIVATSIDPRAFKGYQEGVTEGTARDLAFSTDPAKQDQGRRGQRAMKGETRYNVDGDEKIDQMDPSGKGFQGQTTQGRAKTNKANAEAAAAREQADLRERTDQNRPRGGGGGANTPEYKAEKELLDKVEGELKAAKAGLQRAEDNRVNALGEAARKEAQSLIDRRRAEVDALEARAKEHRTRMMRIADGAPRGTPPAATPAPAPAGAPRRIVLDRNGNPVR